jgi:delta-aminolevulinic acid dehydratase/porphobilinogen synthase
VSGEYSMIMAAVQSSWIDRDEAMMEEPHRLQRAGPTGVDLVCATGGGEAVQGLSSTFPMFLRS